MKEVTVATYNVHGCVGTDRSYDPARILEVIKTIQPSILGLQEVRHHTGATVELLDMVRRSYPNHQVLFLKTLTDDRGEYGNGLISAYPVEEHIDVELDNRPGYEVEARRAIFARLNVAGKRLWVIVTHLGVEGRARRWQAQSLIQSIHRYCEVGTEPVLFMGDFNEWRRPNHLIRRLDHTFTRHRLRRTFPSWFPIFPLDRIWMSSSLVQREVWAHRTAGSRIASDHLPLCARFDFLDSIDPELPQ